MEASVALLQVHKERADVRRVRNVPLRPDDAHFSLKSNKVLRRVGVRRRSGVAGERRGQVVVGELCIVIRDEVELYVCRREQQRDDDAGAILAERAREDDRVVPLIRGQREDLGDLRPLIVHHDLIHVCGAFFNNPSRDELRSLLKLKAQEVEGDAQKDPHAGDRDEAAGDNIDMKNSPSADKRKGDFVVHRRLLLFIVVVVIFVVAAAVVEGGLALRHRDALLPAHQSHPHSAGALLLLRERSLVLLVTDGGAVAAAR